MKTQGTHMWLQFLTSHVTEFKDFISVPISEQRGENMKILKDFSSQR